MDTSIGNQIAGNEIYNNGVGTTAGPKTADGIVLTNGGNGDQISLKIDTAVQTAPGQVTVSGKVKDPSYPGPYRLEFFLTSSNSTSVDQAQGRKLIATETGVPAGDFSFPIVSGSQSLLNSFITVTATPTTAPLSTSSFSDAVTITA